LKTFLNVLGTDNHVTHLSVDGEIGERNNLKQSIIVVLMETRGVKSDKN